MWLVVALFVHRGYRSNLLAGIRHRMLDPTVLSLDDANRVVVADRLLDSDDVRDVRLGLEVLAHGARPGLGHRLEQLSSDARAIVRADALHRLPGIDPTRAAMAARRGLADPDAGVRAAAAHVLALVGDRTDLHAIEVHLGDEDPDVRVAVLGAMARLGDADARRQVSEEVTRLGSSSDSSARVLAARVLGAHAAASEIERGSLGLLIHDEDDAVANGPSPRFARSTMVAWSTRS